MKKLLLLLYLSFLLISLGFSQTNYLMNSNTAITVTCPATSTYFYDDGNSGANYLNNKVYTKTFTSSNGQSLQFTFTSFSTQTGNDILTIYDGPNNTYPVIGQFSGVISPGTVVSSTADITFNWTSSVNTSKAGWAATITCVTAPTVYNMTSATISPVCSGIFYDNGGVGGNYLDNSNLTETFSASSGSCLSATFYGFTVQSGDLLYIYDGTSTSSPLIGSFSGTTLPFKTLLSSSGSLTFNFISNAATNGGGWSVILSCDVCPPATPTAPNADYTMFTTGQQGTYAGGNMVNTCGATFADNGDFAGNYSNNINQVYRNFCPNTAGNCLRMNIYSMNLSSSDWLNVINSPTQNGTSLSGNMSGTCTDYANCIGKGFGPFTSYDQSGCLSMRFYSNLSVNNSGFVSVLDCVPCSNGPTGTDNSDCQNFTALCDNSSFDAASTGPGLVSDGGVGCVIAENYTNWYTFTMSSSGNIGLTIDPVTNADDYDFSLYGPNVSCSSLGSPVRCSYAANTSNTGMGNGATDLTETVTGNGWVKTIDVLAGEVYYLMVNKWSPGGDGFNLSWTLTGGASLDCTVLPVTLTSFTCDAENGLITLDWQSQSEFNNDHYVVEKSSDGENFIPLTLVPGKGTTTLPTEYFVVDNHPFSGNNYYQLSQVDKNGNEAILQTTLCSSGNPNEQLTLKVFDISGKLLFSTQLISRDYESVMRELSFPNGVYVTAIIHNDGEAEINKYLRMY